MKKRNTRLTQLQEQASDWIAMELKPNVRNYQYQLTKLTSWGFYSGGEMISIDSLLASQIVEELQAEVMYAPEHFILELNEIFDFIPYEWFEGVE